MPAEMLVGRRCKPSWNFLHLVTALLALSISIVSGLSAQTSYVEAWGYNDFGQCNVPAGLSNVLAVAAGSDFSLALKNDHTVVAWGYNLVGQCNVPPGLSDVTAISASAEGFALALKSDGTVVAWGNSANGHLNIPPGLSGVQAVAAGENHSLALKSDGTVIAWGYNEYGETNVPVGLGGVVAIAAGKDNSMALKSDGTLVAWGYNGSGQNNIPAGTSSITAIVTYQHTLALKQDGTVLAWGTDEWGECDVPAGLSGIVSIALGASHSVALKSDGTLVAWGRNSFGDTSIPPGLSSITAMCAGLDHNLVLTAVPVIWITTQPLSVTTNAGATVSFSASAKCQVPLTYQWRKDGTNLSGANASSLAIGNVQAPDLGGYSVVISHSSGSLTSSVATLAFIPPQAAAIVGQPQNVLTLAGATVGFNVTASGTPPLTYQWRKNGTDLTGQTAPSLSIANVQSGDAGPYAVVVSNASGSVTSTPAILTLLSSPLALSPASTVVSLGGPPIPDGLNDIVAIAAGFGQQLAVRSNGTVVCWGNNLFGNAQPPADLSNVVAVASGGIHSIALKRDGTVVGWGFKGAPPAGLSGVVAIASGHDQSIALKSDGTAVTWGGIILSPPAGNNLVAVAGGGSFDIGLNNNGTVPTNASTPIFFPGASSITAIAAGYNNIVLLRNDGSVSGWNTSVPANLSNVVAVSSGLALRSDGTVVGLGSAAPAGMTNVTAISGAVGNGLVLTRWPVITQPPQDQTVNGSTPATFSVVAAGAPQLTYQWRKGGTNIDGATGATLTISNAQPADAGSYDVIVNNDAGSIGSTAAILTVNSFPAITTPPRSETLYVGMKVDLTVTATGAQPLSYQWRHAGTEVSGANGSILSLNNVQMSDAGSYLVVVTNSSGSVTSAPAAILTVISNSFILPPPGTVVGLGGPAVPVDLTNAVAIAAGFDGFGQEVAVRSDGTVVCWGNNASGTPQPPAGLSNVVAVSSGSWHSIALKRDGTVVGWGVKSTAPAGLAGVVAIASGFDHSIALKADGTAVSWGLTLNGAPSSNSNLVAVAAGANFNIGVRSDGTVPTNNAPFGFPGAGNITAIAASGLNTIVMLRNDGTVAGWNTTVPAGLSNVVAISSGLALRSDGTVVGLGATAPAGLTNVTAISGSVGRGLVLTTNPPPPILSGASSDSDFLLSTKVSVPGYVLEASDTPAGPFTVIESYTNATASNDFALPLNGPRKYYRLRKQ